MNTIPNRPRLDDVRAMPVGAVMALPAEHLAMLQEDAAAALEASKTLKDWIDGAIARRYAERAQALRRAQDKDTGTIRFEDGPVTVVADLPTKVDWDQGRIGEIVERIRAAGEDPRSYVEISIKVPERKYTAWPETIRQAFEPARTLRTGKPSFRLSLGGPALSAGEL